MDKDKSPNLPSGMAERLPLINANLEQAMALISKLDLGSLPKDAQLAVALVKSAAIHAAHVCHHEGILWLTLCSLALASLLMLRLD